MNHHRLGIKLGAILSLSGLASAIVALSGHAFAAPTVAPARVRVVSSTNYATFGSLRVIGLVKNTTGIAQENVHILVYLKNNKGKTIGGTSGAPLIAVLDPHSTAPFDLTTENAPAGVSSVSYKVTSDPVGQLVKVLSQQASTQGPGEARVIVSIQNMSHSRVFASNLIGVAYDSSGHVVDVAKSDCCPQTSTLDPGAIGSLNLTFAHAQGATHFSVYTNNVTPEN